MKHKKSDGPKLPPCLAVVLCLFMALLICCAKSDDRPQPQTADSKTKEDKPQIAASRSEAQGKKVEASQQKKTVLTSPLAQMGWYPADARTLRRRSPQRAGCLPLRAAVKMPAALNRMLPARGGVTRRRTVWRPSCCSRERDFRDINLTAEPPLFAAFIVRWVAPTSCTCANRGRIVVREFIGRFSATSFTA